jgi:hypothetical protein
MRWSRARLPDDVRQADRAVLYPSLNEGGGTLRVTLLLLLSVSGLFAADPRTGTWKRISAEETTAPPPTMTISSGANGIHMSISDGTDWTIVPDGKFYSVQGSAQVDEEAVRRIGDNILETIRRKAGRPDVHRELQITANRNIMISTNKSTEEANGWHRRDGGADPENPFDGTWVQDEPHVQQSISFTVITVTPDGLNGVHFHENNGLDYRAQFDGKSYPVERSRSDSISMKLVNPVTVEVSWIRNGKIVETSCEMVSADGQELTFTLDGMVAEGIHHRLVYVYRKQ